MQTASPSLPNPSLRRRIARVALSAALFLFTLAGLVACAHTAQRSAAASKAGAAAVDGRSCQEPEEMLDVLSRFTTLVQDNQYHAAIALLDPVDQKRMLAADGSVPEIMKRKLDALNFKALPKDRRVDLVRGRLTGICDCLPCLDQGPADSVARTSPPNKPALSDTAEKRRAGLAKEFYRRIQEGRFDAAGDLVHPEEWKVFVDDKGRMSDLTERRLP
ncbi:MAG: hypothetical protein JF616_03775 [Fibrobacteres bacterium]|jgi:hypothetical protein|nr:hypothetical protein [Fibrobacterota bacterium]